MHSHDTLRLYFACEMLYYSETIILKNVLGLIWIRKIFHSRLSHPYDKLMGVESTPLLESIALYGRLYMVMKAVLDV